MADLRDELAHYSQSFSSGTKSVSEAFPLHDTGRSHRHPGMDLHAVAAWRDVFVYFDNTDKPQAPKDALSLMRLPGQG